jgi:hypothetical protein
MMRPVFTSPIGCALLGAAANQAPPERAAPEASQACAPNVSVRDDAMNGSPVIFLVFHCFSLAFSTRGFTLVLDRR